MCGVFGVSKNSLDDYGSQWDIQKYFEWNDRYNIRPTQPAPLLRSVADGNKLELARFGLIPSWAKTDKMEFPTFNARGETIEQKATFKKPFKEQRGLVPADFFFEFAKLQDGSQPYLFKVKGQGVFSLAAVWDINDRAIDKPILSFSIVTTEANDTVGKIHPRMPVILDPDQAKEWVNPDNNGETEKLKALLKPYPDSKMEIRMVSRLVNNFRNEGPDIIKPI